MKRPTTLLTSVFCLLCLVMLSLLAALPTQVQATDFDQPGYALIAAPKFGEVSHSNEALKLRDYLMDKGWSDDRIIFLGKWDNKDFVDGTATKENIKDGFDEIALKATQDDIVFVAILDHATEGDDGHIYFRTGDTQAETHVKDTEFGGWVDSIPSFRHLVIYIASPYSGNFVEPLEDDMRIILSDCGIDQTYHAGETTFHKALTNTNADSNDDKSISIEEASEWMEEQKRKLDPMFSDFDEEEECFLF